MFALRAPMLAAALATAFTASVALAPPPAHASTAIALSVEDLVERSEHVVVGVPKSRSSRWEGGRIVSYTTVAIDRSVGGGKKAGETLVVRTLGGQVDDVGQITHGEATLPLDHPVVLFLRALPPGNGKALAGALTVTGMAQGALPIAIGADKVARIAPRPVDLALVPDAKADPKVVKTPAAEALAGKPLSATVAQLEALWAARAKK